MGEDAGEVGLLGHGFNFGLLYITVERIEDCSGIRQNSVSRESLSRTEFWRIQLRDTWDDTGYFPHKMAYKASVLDSGGENAHNNRSRGLTILRIGPVA